MNANHVLRFRDLKISTKLAMGFGAFVVLALLVAASSYSGSSSATQKISLTSNVRMPVALTASQAQTDLLRMMGDIRGYLALGDREYWDSYLQSARAFEGDLTALDELRADLDAVNIYRLDQLKTAYNKWSGLPGTLYKLRNDQLEREPAYRILATDGVKSAGKVLIAINSLIDAPQPVSAASAARLQEMARFQGSFAAMLSALRGYTTTRNRIFRQEYEVNLAANSISWDQLWSKRGSLPADQQKVLEEAQKNRDAFLALPAQIFPVLESDQWRTDLALFRTEALPFTDQMQSLLGDMTGDQQTRLTSELTEGRASLAGANRQILAGGIVAVLAGILLAFVSRANIAIPIVRLTGVAQQIQGGDLGAQARVESRDEIGTLATTFNSMTGQLRQTLTQVRKEKTRADNLLNVVIPLGVQLSSEKDFNLLLERTVREATNFCHADGGVLYLRTETECLEPVIVRYKGREVALEGSTGIPIVRGAVAQEPSGNQQKRFVAGEVTLGGQSLNLDLRTDSQTWQYALQLESSLSGGAAPASVLAIPLKNSEGEVVGVLELIDAKDAESARPGPFDANLQQMMESYSSLAAAALEAYVREQRLRQEIKQLRIEIDEVKRQQQVSEIVDTDFFQDLQTRARAMRSRKRQAPAPE